MITSQRIIGFLVLVAGIALLVIGINASHSLADHVSNTFMGRFTQGTTWYLIVGSVLSLLGLLFLLLGLRSSKDA